MRREVLLDSNYYEITDDIHRRNINPRAARFETGPSGYSSFTQASVEAWKGMRGGIGHKYQKSSGTEECWWSEGVDSSHDGGIILGPKINTAGTGDGAFGVAPVKIIDFEDSTYAVGNNKIAKWNTSTSAWDTKKNDFASPLDAIVVTDSTDSYLIVTSGTAAVYSTNGTSWPALSGPKGYLAVFDNKLYGFYANVLYNSPAKASDGTWDIDGTWENCKYMHDLGTVHGLFTAKSQVTDAPLLCLHSSKALWTIDPWVQQAYPYLELTGHTYAGKAGLFWNSYIWVSSLGGIKKIAGSLITDVGPDQNDGLPSGYQGYISDMIVAADGSWMVFAVNGGSTNKSSIFKLHGTIGGIQQIYSTSAINKPITCLHYSPSSITGMTNGRLWWGEDTDIKYCMMPDFNTDVTEISSYEFTTSGSIIYSAFRPLEAFTKLAISVAGVTKACDTDNPITISYYTDNDDDWVELGDFDDEPQPDALSFGSDAGLEFRWIKLKADFTAKASSASPELKSLEFDYDAATKRLRGWTFLVKVKRDDAETIIDNLHTTQDKNTLVLFYPSGNFNKTSYRVKISTLAEDVHWDAEREEGTLQVTVEELLRR
jgi:hypothetical protein